MPGETIHDNEHEADPATNGWDGLMEPGKPSAIMREDEALEKDQPAASESESGQNPHTEWNRKPGAAALAQAGFEKRHSEIVESSFSQARSRGDRLAGTGAERRNQAYLERLDKLISKYGNRMERKLWQMSAERVITRGENITDDYWRTQEQILRDNGRGRTLSEADKADLIREIQDRQNESIASWTDYLGDESAPYPLWFKVYAFDGVSRMGVFDNDRQAFRKRDKSTVAPFPRLNPAALAKTYAAITDFYAIDAGQDLRQNHRDPALAALVQSGNFNKLYAHFLLSGKTAPEVPENPADIHGEWVEYFPGDEERLAAAADGTPWCIASPIVGRNYLEHGTYGEEDGWDDKASDNKAEFILFHLIDPQTNNPAATACASIRLNTEGEVAEISGLRDGQLLDDALVPAVEAKVKTLPGGEKFLAAFEDRKRLIALDRKFQSGTPFSAGDVDFIFNHRFTPVGMYSADPRLEEFRNLDNLLRNGADLTPLKDNPSALSYIDSRQLAEHFEELTRLGVDARAIAEEIRPQDLVDNFERLNSLGADLDIDQIVSGMKPTDVLDNFDKLTALGADLDINEIVSGMKPGELDDNFEKLARLGADIRGIASGMEPWRLVQNLGRFVAAGADINAIVSVMGSRELYENFEKLAMLGADINMVASGMSAILVVDNFEKLTALGADLDINKIASEMTPWEQYYRYDRLTRLGAELEDIDEIKSRM